MEPTDRLSGTLPQDIVRDSLYKYGELMHPVAKMLKDIQVSDDWDHGSFCCTAIQSMLDLDHDTPIDPNTPWEGGCTYEDLFLVTHFIYEHIDLISYPSN